ncbi:MAG: hypothetical protein GY760_01760 [Deltaproteobacteria bacterium]|nr:hypothetical protein [Deltaproteobacteria bacterium]
MNKTEALKIINEEELSDYNFFQQHSDRPNEVIIKLENDKWLVYANDERCNVHGRIKSFSNESDALEEFLKRLRGSKNSKLFNPPKK